MKKVFLLSVMLIASIITFISCSKDDDKIDNLTQSELVGTWNVTSYSYTGDFEDLPNGYIYITINSDNTYRVKFLSNTYSGKYKIDGNTMIGTTSDPITEYFKFDSLNGNNAEISYSNSEGDKYKLKAVKK